MDEQPKSARQPDQSTNLPVYQVRVKVCGLTNLEDAQASAAAGADLLGFIFYEKSPRYADPRTVAKIVGALRYAPRSTLHAPPLFVGVFVNPSAEQVVMMLNHCGLDLAQLHGEEGPDLLLAAGVAGRSFKAVRPRSTEEAEASARRFALLGPAAGPDLLVDAFHPTLRGGSGETGDWRLAAGLARRHRVLLAGGLTPANVAEAVRQVQPWGVDVASGVEAAPGRKDHAAVRAFIAAAKEL